ncbi:MAG: DedA family protein [Candidatus Nanopelagicales bacterium]
MTTYLLPKAALEQQLTGWFNTLGPFLFYLAVWGLVFAGTAFLIGLFLPFITGSSLVFGAGVVSSLFENTNIAILAVGVGFAAFFGDQVAFVLGRVYGRPYLDRRTGPRLAKVVSRTEKFYNAWGWWAVVIARFITWARAMVPVIAGVGKMNYYKFLSSNLVGAMLWGVGLTVSGYFATSIPLVERTVYIIASIFILLSVVAGIRAVIQERRAAKS